MKRWNVVLDTNVLVSALRSNLGASYQVLAQLGKTADFQIHVSVPLVLEYEATVKKQCRALGLTHQDIDDILDYLCAVAIDHDVYFLWRPCLPDPNDDMVLELAVTASCDLIITHNTRDFVGSEQFSVAAITPGEFLRRLGELT